MYTLSLCGGLLAAMALVAVDDPLPGDDPTGDGRWFDMARGAEARPAPGPDTAPTPADQPLDPDALYDIGGFAAEAADGLAAGDTGQPTRERQVDGEDRLTELISLLERTGN